MVQQSINLWAGTAELTVESTPDRVETRSGDRGSALLSNSPSSQATPQGHAHLLFNMFLVLFLVFVT